MQIYRSTCCHPLQVPFADDSPVTAEVLVFNSTSQNVGHRFKTTMGVIGKTCEVKKVRTGLRRQNERNLRKAK